MQFFKETKINFVGNRTKAVYFSVALFLLSVVFLIAHKGMNASIDFVGGTLVQVKFEKTIESEDLTAIRGAIDQLGYGTPEVKTIGDYHKGEIQVIVKSGEAENVGEEIKAAMASALPDNSFTLRREEKVGPKIGGELQEKAIWAILLSLLVIVIYIGMRFRLPFGIAAIVALFHDVIIVLGAFAVFDYELSLPIIAALITIVGYSLNDTIVVFDRIRENMTGTILKKPFAERVNLSINQCLSRTIVTSVTTLIVVLSIFIEFFTSGNVLRDFAFALLVGVLIGTYSSIYIASPVLVAWDKRWPIK